MSIRNGIYRAFVFSCGLLYLSQGFAQAPSLTTTVDRNTILIGEQVKLTVEGKFTPGMFKINWLSVPDTFPHFEVIERGKIDSLYTDEKITGLRQQFTITSFDSGKWMLPAFNIGFDPLNDDTTFNLYTDSLPLIVTYAAADSSGELRDIKPIRAAEENYPLWYWIGAGAILLALVILLVWMYRQWKKNRAKLPVKSKRSAYEEAMEELKRLQQADLSSPAGIKAYHSKLALIVKQYFTYTAKINYMNKTTGELLLLVGKAGINKELQSRLAAALRCGDAVKFAKYISPKEENDNCLLSVKESIESFNNKTSG